MWSRINAGRSRLSGIGRWRDFGVEQAQNMLDHSSVDLALIYAERNREQAIEIARRVG